MKVALRLPVLLVVSFFAFSASHGQEEGFVPMFNGQDLSGWVNANCAPETWSVRDGMICCTGTPTGALRTEKQYENFILECEWRHLSSGGNSGVFVWGSPISAPGVPFLRGIEVQVLDHGYLRHAKPDKPRWFSVHGDVFPIHGATMEPHGDHNGQRSFPSEERSKPSPEWNHYRVTGNNGTVTLAVNGKVVSGGDKCFWRKGYLALESEGAPVEFRNVRIKELPSTGATDEDSAPLDLGWRHLYNGLDLRGWKVAAGATEKWQAMNWNLKLQSSGGQASAPLWSVAELSDGEFIADFQLPKDANLSKPCAGFCLRGEAKPAVQIGGQTNEAPCVFGGDHVKPGKWYRVKVKLVGAKATVTLTEPQDANPQVQEITLTGNAGGPVGVADLGVPVTFANFFIHP